LAAAAAPEKKESAGFGFKQRRRGGSGELFPQLPKVAPLIGAFLCEFFFVFHQRLKMKWASKTIMHLQERKFLESFALTWFYELVLLATVIKIFF